MVVYVLSSYWTMILTGQGKFTNLHFLGYFVLLHPFEFEIEHFGGLERLPTSIEDGVYTLLKTKKVLLVLEDCNCFLVS